MGAVSGSNSGHRGEYLSEDDVDDSGGRGGDSDLSDGSIGADGDGWMTPDEDEGDGSCGDGNGIGNGGGGGGVGTAASSGGGGNGGLGGGVNQPVAWGVLLRETRARVDQSSSWMHASLFLRWCLRVDSPLGGTGDHLYHVMEERNTGGGAGAGGGGSGGGGKGDVSVSFTASAVRTTMPPASLLAAAYRRLQASGSTEAAATEVKAVTDVNAVTEAAAAFLGGVKPTAGEAKAELGDGDDGGGDSGGGGGDGGEMEEVAVTLLRAVVGLAALEDTPPMPPMSSGGDSGGNGGDNRGGGDGGEGAGSDRSMRRGMYLPTAAMGGAVRRCLPRAVGGGAVGHHVVWQLASVWFTEIQGGEGAGGTCTRSRSAMSSVSKPSSWYTRSRSSRVSTPARLTK